MRDVHLAGRDLCGKSVLAGAARTESARDNVEFIALPRQLTLKILQLDPGPLVIVGGLGEDVRHKERGIVVRSRVRPVFRVANVSAVKSAVVVVGLLDLLKRRGEAVIRVEVASVLITDI